MTPPPGSCQGYDSHVIYPDSVCIWWGCNSGLFLWDMGLLEWVILAKDSSLAGPKLFYNCVAVWNNSYPVLLPFLSPSQVSDLHRSVKALLPSLAPSSLPFVSKFVNKSFAYLIPSWHLLLGRSKLTQKRRPKLLTESGPKWWLKGKKE